MNKTKNYRYIIELDTPIWPRKIVDDLSYTPGLFTHLVSVTDLQNDGHIYGATYELEGRPVSAARKVVNAIWKS